MWHASAGSLVLTREDLEAHARRMIRGVGDASLGEWVERERTTPEGIAVVHVRRRLTPAEQARVGPRARHQGYARTQEPGHDHIAPDPASLLRS